MKKRSNCHSIVVSGHKFQYALSHKKGLTKPEEIDLVVYNDKDERIEISGGEMKTLFDHADPSVWIGKDGRRTWRGKHGDGCMGKKQIAYAIQHLILNKRYMTAEEMMKGANPCPEIKELYHELAKDQPLIDPVALRRAQDWSAVNGQVVGGEVPVESHKVVLLYIYTMSSGILMDLLVFSNMEKAIDFQRNLDTEDGQIYKTVSVCCTMQEKEIL